MKTKLFIFMFCISNFSFSQWSTSPYTQDALFVCHGFIPNIFSLEDGSCYVVGGLSDCIFVQKLDPAGYKLWSQPIQVFNTPGTDNYNYTMVSDGLGGLIFIWEDFRGAYYFGDPAFPCNNALYMQRIDKDGNTVWQTDGIQIAPIDGGFKKATIVNDGNGGAIVMLGENDFEKPTSPMKEWTWLRRYDKLGNIIWNIPIDSSTSSNKVFPPSGLVRLDSLTRFKSINEFRFIQNNGLLVDSLRYKPIGGIVVVTDSGAYEIRNLPDRTDSLGNRLFVARIIRITNKWDSLWSTDFEIPDEADENRGYFNLKNPYVSDGIDGLFFLWSFIDKTGLKRARLQHITSQGVAWQNYGLDFSGNYGFATFSGKNEAGIFFENGTVQKFNLNGQPMWQDSMVIIADPSEAFFKAFASDNNGGLIVAFWTTTGGIYAQHSGRSGKLGVITRVHDTKISFIANFELLQNYPNPFNPNTTIKYSIKVLSDVRIIISDILGRKITELVKKRMNPGTYEVLWNASNYASGIYFYSMYLNEKIVSTKKLLLTK